jgi:hypothetical protein
MSENEKVKESITIRGVCASVQAMAMPTLENLLSLLAKAGIHLEKKKD